MSVGKAISQTQIIQAKPSKVGKWWGWGRFTPFSNRCQTNLPPYQEDLALARKQYLQGKFPREIWISVGKKVCGVFNTFPCMLFLVRNLCFALQKLFQVSPGTVDPRCQTSLQPRHKDCVEQECLGLRGGELLSCCSEKHEDMIPALKIAPLSVLCCLRFLMLCVSWHFVFLYLSLFCFSLFPLSVWLISSSFYSCLIFMVFFRFFFWPLPDWMC